MKPSDPEVKINTTTTTRRAFAELLQPLEVASGRRLGNPKRDVCLRAFEEFPEGVKQVVADVLADATRNFLGLFVFRIEHGWHELEPLPQPEPPPPWSPPAAGSRAPRPPRPRIETECMRCWHVKPCIDDGRLVICDDCRGAELEARA